MSLSSSTLIVVRDSPLRAAAPCPRDTKSNTPIAGHADAICLGLLTLQRCAISSKARPNRLHRRRVAVAPRIGLGHTLSCQQR